MECTASLPVGGVLPAGRGIPAVLGALGLTVLLDSTYAFCITFALLGMALLALGFRAKARRGYAPFILGVVSAGMIPFIRFA